MDRAERCSALRIERTDFFHPLQGTPDFTVTDALRLN
jgi:hypothetical protein